MSLLKSQEAFICFSCKYLLDCVHLLLLKDWSPNVKSWGILQFAAVKVEILYGNWFLASDTSQTIV